MHDKDVNDLAKKRYLDTNLIDFLLQNSLSHVHTDKTTLFIGPALFPSGIAGIENDVFEEAKTKAIQRKRVQKKKASLARFSKKGVTFLAPVIEERHFFTGNPRGPKR